MLKHFSYMTARARLAIWNDQKATLSGLISGSPGQGHATKLMQEITDYADSEELRLYLVAQRFHYSDQRGLTNKELVQFYSKFGFELTPDLNNPRAYPMQRFPQNLHVF